MPYREVFTCAGCGKEKGEVNHWWIAGNLRSEIANFRIEPWNHDGAIVGGVDSYCGQECLTKALSEWMHRVNPNVGAAKP